MSTLLRFPRTLDETSLARAWETQSTPFPYVVIDHFFEHADAVQLHEAFPSFSARENAKARLFSGRVYGAPESHSFASAYAGLASRDFVRALSVITKIEPLAMDESLAGAGPHIGLSGSSLAIHADHNTHPAAPYLYRRLNLLIYLNPHWESSWRANLLLYDRAGQRKVVEIEPRFNRAVLMEVSDSAFHGYRTLRLPRGRSRQMLAAYYYSLAPCAAQTREPHGTTFAAPQDIPVVELLAERARRKAVYCFQHLMPRPSWPDEHGH